MDLLSIINILDAEAIAAPPRPGLVQISSVFVGDLMSDVLSHAGPDTLIITALCTSQPVRVAEVVDAPAVCFVQNKMPQQSVLELARSKGIVIIVTPYCAYRSSALLYRAGLQSAVRPGGYNGGYLEI